MQGIIVFGVCDLTKGSLDIFQKNNLMVYGILEDQTKWHCSTIQNIPVLGGTNDPAFLRLLNEACPYFIAYRPMEKRKDCLNFLRTQQDAIPISAIHPSVIMADATQLGQGNYIGTEVCLASEVTIGNHCILHNGVIIESETHIHDWVEIGAGSIIGSQVTLEEEVFIGMGVTIISGVTIQKGASIGAGSVVLGNVKKGDVLLGNPAKSIQPSKKVNAGLGLL
ncbi:Sugar O-acyltransferase, sialic acid O-acetyltransferase NeuD family [Cardinium endosymbiont cEper1 of Encarsia pergandiella]|uniref:Sugar O-acyltransferase sialic acid O-acetyltransferase NeuD family n=1 Tax=Cardinium endosymbiont of Encarsia pergandiella TaxID=249402 RepID=UPI00027E9C00|nr:Sugar O-acyltransferase sialic acid O-acetyltransferase NeuD family [Cardinium endosymbiont of Encarsia pergandiella]CCM09989.1 Sugar O-acyltransferase, sialic acid O-acetyltransferase NeuD family [Cardinium endosymbiont cEper1 of Encarsia pergandiella]